MGIGYRGLLSARFNRPILALFSHLATLRATNTCVYIYEGLVVDARLILAYNAGSTSFVQCIPESTRWLSAIRAQDLPPRILPPLGSLIGSIKSSDPGTNIASMRS